MQSNSSFYLLMTGGMIRLIFTCSCVYLNPGVDCTGQNLNIKLYDRLPRIDSSSSNSKALAVWGAAWAVELGGRRLSPVVEPCIGA